jgi:hypothetical protein
VQELLDHDAAPGLPERAIDQGAPDRRLRLLAVVADRDALAGREPVRLDDQRIGLPGNVGERRRGVVERRVGRGRDALLPEKRLRVGLRPLQLRRRPPRPEDGDAPLDQPIRQAEGERQFGADDDEPDPSRGRPIGDSRRRR